MSANATLLLLGLLASGAAAAGRPYMISERSLRLPADATITLTASPGCFEWSSERFDIASIVEGSVRCDGESSSVEIRTHAPSGGGSPCAFITAHPILPDDAAPAKSEAPPADLFCEINVAEVAKIGIRMTTHHMVSHELQWFALSAVDREGNTFSPPGLHGLDVSWSISPSDAITPVPPSETSQRLNPSLRAVEAGGGDRWRTYYKLAVLAAAHPTERVRVDAQVSGRGGPTTTEILTVEPSSLELAPKALAIVAPLMSLHYALRTCGTGGRCSAPPPGRVGPTWRIEPGRVARVAAGSVTALAAGACSVSVSQPLFADSAPILVTPPLGLELELLDVATLEPDATPPAADGSRVLLVGGSKLARLTLVPRGPLPGAKGKAHGPRPMVLPAASTRPPRYLLPSLEQANASAADGGSS